MKWTDFEGREKIDIEPPIKVKAKILNMNKGKNEPKYKVLDINLIRYSGLNSLNERIFIGRINTSFSVINENNIVK